MHTNTSFNPVDFEIIVNFSLEVPFRKMTNFAEILNFKNDYTISGKRSKFPFI